MNRILVTGAGGQLGRALLRCLGDRAVGLGHAELAIQDAQAVQAVFDRTRPNGVINAAAFTHVDRAEREPEAAYRVNRDGAARLAEAAARRGLPFVHVSTDYVFDGSKTTPWMETDPTGPLGVYGASKLAGEAAVRAAHAEAVVVRTSWVFSRDGANFVKTILRLAGERPVLRVVDDQHGCPTSADELARAACAALAWPAGIYHFAGDGATTWYGFARAILDVVGANVRLEPIPTSDYPTPARRPAYSVLDTGRVRALGLSPAPWRVGLCDMLK